LKLNANTESVRGDEGRGTIAWCLLAYGLLVFLRYPWLLLHGRLWGEEGPVYFRTAWSGSMAAALFAPHQGYLAVWPNLSALIAGRFFPLPFAALILTWSAFLVQMLAGYLVLRCERFATLKSKLLALGVLLAASSYEVWLNTINSQFFFMACVAVIFLSRPERLQIRRNLVLVFAGLTGPVSASLAPFFVLRAFVRKTRAAAVQAGVLSACALVQAGVMLHVHAAREILFQPSAIAPVYLVRFIVRPFLSGVTESLAQTVILGQASPFSRMSWVHTLPLSWPFILLWAILDLAFIGWLFYLTAETPDRSSWWLLLMGLWLTLVTMYGAYTGTITVGGRYVFPSTVLIGFALLLATMKRRMTSVRRVAVLTLLTCLLLSGTKDYFQYRKWAAMERNGMPTWETRAESWEHDPTVKLPVWPKGWPGFSLPPDHR
jgi:hypothetical protein